MRTNRSIPDSDLIPVIDYPDVGAAADWLCAALGFAVRLRIKDHRIQLSRGDAALVVRNGKEVSDGGGRCSMLLRVEDVDGATARVASLGGRIVDEPSTRVFGERQSVLLDPWGTRWTLSQTVADVSPEDWLDPN